MKLRLSGPWLLLGCGFLLCASCAAAISQDGEDYFPVRENGKIGFMDKTGKIVISPQFDSTLSEDGVIFSEGLAAVYVGDKWGYIDKTGKFVIPPKFKQTFAPSLFHEGLAQVEIQEGTSSFIDKTGEFVKALKFIEQRTVFSEGLARVSKGDKIGYVDKTGRFVIEARFDEAEDFSEGLAAVKVAVKVDDTVESKFGFIDKTGRMVIEPQFSEARSFSEGLAAVTIYSMDPKGYGYIDKTGKVVIAQQFDDAHSFSEGLAKIVMRGEKFIDKAGFIDKSGKFVIALQFEQRPGGSSLNYRGFRDGLAAVEVNNKTGYIDKTGKMVIAASYDYGSEFRGGIAQVTSGLEAKTQKSYYIDKTGKVIREQNPR